MLRNTLRWIRNEWGIITRGSEMTTAEKLRWLGDWVPFGVRTIFYGGVSLTLGPVTPDHKASAWAQRRWSRASLRGLRIATSVAGTEHAPRTGGFIYASNHQSLIDILVLGATLPRDVRWVTKRSIMNVPFLGWHLRFAGHVPVDRGTDRRAAVDAIKRFEAVVAGGKPLLIFPEGTRTLDGEIQPFKTGAFYAAVRQNVPIVPVALEGTFDLMSKKAVHTGGARRRDVRVAIGAPIVPRRDGKEGDRVNELRDRTHEAVLALHATLRAPAPRPARSNGAAARVSEPS